MSYGGIIGQQPALEASGISYNNNQTSSIITGDNVQTAIDQLFTSVSNGKNKIASAITDKGVSTSPSDSFDVMAGNIGKIQSYDIEKIDKFCNFTGSGNLNDVTNTVNIISQSSSTGGLSWIGSMGYAPMANQCSNNINFQLTIYPTLGEGYLDYGGLYINYNKYGEITNFNESSHGDIRDLKVNASGNANLTTVEVSYRTPYPYPNGQSMKIKFTLNLTKLNAKFDITLSKTWPLAK